MAVAVVTTAGVVLFDDAAAANTYVRAAANRGVLKDALRGNRGTGRVKVLSVDETNITP